MRLKGAKFTGGHLPVDSLVELEHYQAALRVLATADWQAKNPGESIPPDFFESLGLTILKVEEGSADLYLAFENAAQYSEYKNVAQDSFDATIFAAYSNLPLPELPSSVEDETRSTIAAIGSTLTGEQSIEVFLSDESESPVVITIETRAVARDRLLLDGFWQIDDDLPKSELTQDSSSLAGRITLLDADAQTFMFNSLAYGPLKGWYANKPELLDDFKSVLDDSSNGPVTRLDGRIQSRNGTPWRIKETTSIQLFAASDSTWAGVLIEFASLAPGWAGKGQGFAIAFPALEAADRIMSEISERGLELPGLFPTVDGGVLIEWSNTQFVRSIEVTPDLTYELFNLPPGTSQGEFEATENLMKALEFATNGVK